MSAKHNSSEKPNFQPVFHKVAENLYRLESSGGYYALVKKGGKQFRRSLKTKDRKLAERLAENSLNVTVHGKGRFSREKAQNARKGGCIGLAIYRVIFVPFAPFRGYSEQLL